MDVQFGPYQLKRQERRLLGPNGTLDLSGRSFDILALLLGRPDEVISKTEIFDVVWPDVVVEENTLQAHISSLRKLLEPSMIVTVHGRGYKYAGPPPLPTTTLQAPSKPVAPPPEETAASYKSAIVVLPFENQGGVPEQQYFSDGITQDITDRLTRFRMLSVVSQHSAFAFRGGVPNYVDIRSKLKADFVVTGSIRRTGDHVRIAVRLTDARNATAA